MRPLPPPPLTYLITPGRLTTGNFAQQYQSVLDSIRAAVHAGVSLIQIREKTLSGRLLFELTAAASELTRASSTLLLINDRPDIALTANADGVHLPADSLPARVVRSEFPREFIIGVSTHTAAEVRSAAGEGADLAVFGPVFDTPGKNTAKGLDALAEACREVPGFTVLALGGVDADSYRFVLDAGAVGFAAIRSLNDPASLNSIMQELTNE